MKKLNTIGYSLYLIIIVGIFIYFFRICVLGRYGSDWILHAEAANRLSDAISISGINGYISFLKNDVYSGIAIYPFWHLSYVVVRLPLNHLFSTNIANWLALSLTTSFYLTFTYIILLKAFFTQTTISVFPAFVSSLLLLVGPLDGSMILGNYYLGAYTGNPWHNPTYLCVKPVAMLVFFLYVKVLESNQHVRLYYLASISLLLSAFFKPILYQILIPGLVLYCILFLIKNRSLIGFLDCVKLALTCLPCGILALAQLFLLPRENGDAIGFSLLYVWRSFTSNWFLSLIFSIAFPIAALLLYAKQFIQSRKYILSLCIFVSALLQYSCLYIKAFPLNGDFSWGFDLSIFILFVSTMSEFLKIQNKGHLKCIIVWLVFIGHVFFGSIYYLTIICNRTVRGPLFG